MGYTKQELLQIIRGLDDATEMIEYLQPELVDRMMVLENGKYRTTLSAEYLQNMITAIEAATFYVLEKQRKMR